MNNSSKLKDKEYNADQVVVMPTCNFHTLEANGSECCLQGQSGPHTQNVIHSTTKIAHDSNQA
jgi:hypothetical protein